MENDKNNDSEYTEDELPLVQLTEKNKRKINNTFVWNTHTIGHIDSAYLSKGVRSFNIPDEAEMPI